MNHARAATAVADLTLAMLRTAVALADRCVISDIESEGNVQIDAAGQRWYDVTPMLDERELAPECRDMNREGLAWAVARQLVVQHPSKPYLLRICPR